MLPSASVQLPKGRQLVGDRVTYDVNVGLPGELQPQLEAMVIELHESDPGLVLGRKIAVNRTYICYGLKPGAIRVLNINTGRISLLKGHTQRVTDMAFFSEDVHLLASSSIDGRIFVWKINEGPDENDKQLITGKVVVAIHMVGDGESFHPHICWHSITQEILVVAIGNRILKIDMTKVGKDEVFVAEKPIKCPVEKLIDGIQLVGKHEGEVTDLSMCHWMITRLVSASTDGMVKIWTDEKAVPLVTLRPHDGQPVNSVTFLIAPRHPDHIVLITAGHLNREVKVWASAGKEGWLLPSDCKSWQCIQTLDLKSSTEPRPEEAFFNQVVVLPDSGLVLLANAKKNAIYVVHVEYGRYPTATRMDYIAEFTVSVPILSLTGRSDYSPDGKHVEVYCVQTQAIQQYTLDLSKCLPPPLKNAGIEKVSASEFSALDPCCGNVPAEMPVGGGSAAAKYPVFSGNLELPIVELATSSVEPNPSALPPQSLRLSGRLSFRNPSNNFEPGPTLCNRCVDPPVLDYSVDRRVDVGCMKLTDVPSLDDSSVKDETEVGKNDISTVPNPPITFKVGEIPLKVVSSSESSLVGQGSKVGEEKVQDVAVSNDIKSGEVEVKEVGQQQELDSEREKHILHTEIKEKSFYTQASDLGIEMAKDGCSLSTEISGVEETRQVKDVGVAELLDRPSNAGELGIQDLSKDVPNTKSSMATVFSQSPSSAGKIWKKKVNPSQVAGPSSPSTSPFKFAESSNEPGSSNSSPSTETTFTQIRALQDSVKEGSEVGEEKVQDVAVSNDIKSGEVGVKEVGQQQELDSEREKHILHTEIKEKSFYTQASDLGIEMAKDGCSLSTEISGVEETCQVKDVGVAELLDRPSNAGELGIQDLSKDVPNTKSSMATVFSQSPSSAGKIWKKKVNPSQVAGPSSPSTSPFKFAESSNEPGSSNSSPSTETTFTQIRALQDSVKEGSEVGEEKVQDVAVSNDIKSGEVGVKEVGQQQELDSEREKHILHTEIKEKSFYTQASDLGIEMAKDGCSLSTEISGVEETRQVKDVGVAELLDRPSNAGELGIQDLSKDVPNTKSSMATVFSQSPSSAGKIWKKKVNPSQVAGPSSPSTSPFKFAESSNEPGSSNSSPSMETTFTQIRALQDSVKEGSEVGEEKVQDVAVSNDIKSGEVGVKEVGQQQELDSEREKHILHTEIKEKSFYTQASDLGIEMAKDGCSLSTEISGVEETCQVKDVGVAELLDRPSNAGELGIQDLSKDVPNTKSNMATVFSQSPSSAGKIWKKKVNPSQVAGPSSPSTSPFKFAESSNEPGSSNSSPSTETTFTQIRALQDSVKELTTIQKEIQKQMTALVAVLVNKEGSRVEAALSQSMEKALKSNSDALWESIQEENKKQKLERDRIKQIVSSISGSMNTKWPAMFKKTLKQEISAIGPAVSHAITPILEKTISSAIADSFQRGVGNKAVNQLENSLNSKLEATVARQIQVQFQTSGKQNFQDALRASLESSVIPAFEQACKAMFEQVDATFQKGMSEHTAAAQQQFESTHSPLALALRDAMSSASSITQTLSGELANGQRNLLAFMAAGATQKTMNPLATQQNDGPLGEQHDMVEAPLDPKKELERLISEHKYEEAFTSALQRSNITIVSWLCSQVDLQGILAVFPLPLSQGVLLSLLHQLACNIGNETSKKLDWMRDILAAIDPVDPMITVHGRSIFEQVYQILDYQKALPTTTVTETSSIRLLMHVINSVLMNYK